MLKTSPSTTSSPRWISRTSDRCCNNVWGRFDHLKRYLGIRWSTTRGRLEQAPKVGSMSSWFRETPPHWTVRRTLCLQAILILSALQDQQWPDESCKNELTRVQCKLLRSTKGVATLIYWSALIALAHWIDRFWPVPIESRFSYLSKKSSHWFIRVNEFQIRNSILTTHI